MPRASIIIPAYVIDDEVWECAHRMLESINRSFRDEIILVENGSSHLGAYLGSDRYLHYDNPLGCARSQNLGLALARGDYVVIVSLDVVFRQPDWLDRLIAEYQRVGPGILSPDDHERSGVWEESWYAVWMMDQGTFRQLGYLDENLPFLYSDQDYSIRAAKAGFKVQRTAAVQVDHVHERSTMKKMSFDSEPEAEIMMARHGALHFREWLALGRPKNPLDT